jgi:hypothetical protein
MSWAQLLATRKVHKHRTSKQELDELRSIVERDLEDAAIPALSEDRRFATAYNAALQTAKMAIACAGSPKANIARNARSLYCVQQLIVERKNTTRIIEHNRPSFRQS